MILLGNTWQVDDSDSDIWEGVTVYADGTVDGLQLALKQLAGITVQIGNLTPDELFM